MTNKRKIQILKKVIKTFERLIPKFEKNKMAYYNLGLCHGICNYIYHNMMTYSEKNEVFSYRGVTITTYFKKEFKIKMPSNSRRYKWALNKKGYQSRIKACKQAIKELSK